MEKKIEVKTSAGTICAEVNCDPGAPGIYLYFIPKKADVEIDLAFAGVKEDSGYRCENESGEDVLLYLWEDVNNEDWTKKINFKRTDVIEMCLNNNVMDVEED